MPRQSKIRGVGRLRMLLRRIPDEITRDVREAVASAAGIVLRDALRRVPRDTGELSRELRILFGRDRLSAQVGIIGARSLKRAYYARWIEYGTQKRPARPFLFPALESNMPRITRILDAAVNRALERASSAAARVSEDVE